MNMFKKTLRSLFTQARDLTDGVAATPFVSVISSVLIIVIGIELVGTVVAEVDAILTVTNAPGSAFPLAGTVAQFVPVVYIAAIMGIAGFIGYVGANQTSGGFTGLIMAVLVVVIGVALGSTVVNSSAAALVLINAAVNPMTLAATIMPFLPVVYIAAILGLAGMAGYRGYKSTKAI